MDTNEERSDWPVLVRYDRDHLARIALPLGGIGTGTVSLGGRGDLRDWEVVNRPAKGFAPSPAFFALRIAGEKGENPMARLLEGPLPPAAFEGAFGATALNHGLPRFREASFGAAYPLGEVSLSDPEVPVTVRLRAFNPLIPTDSERSAIPVALLRFLVSSQAREPLALTVCGVLKNFIGADGSDGKPDRNRNSFLTDSGVSGLLLSSEGIASDAEQWGTLALATTAPDVSYRTDWAHLPWGDSLLDFWDDLLEDGRLEERFAPEAPADAPVASLAATAVVAPGETVEFTFLLTWRFPNRLTWTPKQGTPPERVGNYYAAGSSDAWEIARKVVAELPELEADTLDFVRAFTQSDLPVVVREAALFNLSTLRSQTCFRTEDGRFFGFEGCGDKSGCCVGSCTHVWNYEQATPFLFADLARTMREVEFAFATTAEGRMSFRAHLPLERATEDPVAAADGQMGCLMKLYREWQLSGDDAFLRALWPKARKALEFCWIEGGWDADRDGVMEGCQHNTMDVEYYGPNPQMGTWYLGALRAAEEMATHLGESDFAATCRELFARGSAWLDGHLFNGEYYEQRVLPPGDESAIAPALRLGAGARNLTEPELQLGAGCLVDQLVGQYMAHICALGYLLEPEHIRVTLQSILRYNFQEHLWNHFNHLRSFAMADESALLMASYPHGNRPRRPFPYYNEAMTGFEYTAAVGMLYEGQQESGLKVIQAVRSRYDGQRRNPFDEAECGHHYARAMASWGAVLALTGFHYSAVRKSLRFAAADRQTRWFWSTGSAWGMVRQSPRQDALDLELTVSRGSLTLSELWLTGWGGHRWEHPATVTPDSPLALTLVRAVSP